MISLVFLLVASALVSLQTTSAYTLQNPKDLDNSLEPNVIPEIPSPRRKTVQKYVRILGPPPKTIRFVPGSVLVIACDVMGQPAPVVGWLKNGIPISDFEEDTNEIATVYPVSFGIMTSKLVVHAPEDGDVFTCVAVSGLKQAKASTTVYVENGEITEDMFPHDLLKPIITTSYTDLMTLMGTSVTLPCRVYSSTPSQIFWLDIGNELIYENPRMNVLPSGSLHITGLVWGDMGGYTCTVKNMYGKDSNTTFLYPLSP